MTNETLMSGQNTQVADSQQAATTPTDGQQAAPASDQATQQQQQATEGQNAQGQQAEGAKPEGDQGNTEQKPGAPEKYEFAAPEGLKFDEAVVDAFSEVAKELNLPQEAAQKVLDKMAPMMVARQAEQMEAARTEWAGSSKTDKEFGGDKLEENLGIARKARDAFATPELRTLLDDTGLGNHPEVIRFFYRAGKAISEDKIVGGKAAQPNSSDARSLYPNSNLK